MKPEFVLKRQKKVFDELIKWLETHNGKMPRCAIYIDGKKASQKELIGDQRYEVQLYTKWQRSQLKTILKDYVGKPIKDVPIEYQEMIMTLRKYLLETESKTTYILILDWLKEHNGEIPHSSFTKDKRPLSSKEMTEEQKTEIKLYKRWSYSMEKAIFDKYKGKPIEDVPEEFREKISLLRQYVKIGKKQNLKKIMKENVSKQIESNRTPKNEIEGIEKEIDNVNIREEDELC